MSSATWGNCFGHMPMSNSQRPPFFYLFCYPGGRCRILQNDIFCAIRKANDYVCHNLCSIRAAKTKNSNKRKTKISACRSSEKPGSCGGCARSMCLHPRPRVAASGNIGAQRVGGTFAPRGSTPRRRDNISGNET